MEDLLGVGSAPRVSEMVQMTDVAHALHVGRVNDEELLFVLLGYFGSAEQDGGLIRFLRRGESRDQCLDVLLGSRGQIQAAKTGPHFPPEKVEIVRREVERSLVRDQKLAVTQRVGFCGRPVE